MSEITEKKPDSIGYEQLRLYWPYRAQWLENVQITRQVNEHAKLYVSGILPEEDGPGILQVQAEGEPIVLRQIDESGKSVRRLFHGVMTSFTVHLSGGIYRFELEAMSNSYQMDIRLEERAFQNRGWTFKELIQFIMKPYPNSDVLDQVTGDTKLSNLVLQYKETDWNFLRRLASRFGTVLVPEITAASPKLFIGLPVGKLWKWPEDQPYQVRKELGGVDWHGSDVEHRYIIRGPKGTQGVLQYTMESSETYALGDKVELPDGRELTVVYAYSRMESGLLMTTYRMVPEDQIRVPRCDLSDLIGLSLYGEVVRVIHDHVQLSLPMDEGPMTQGAACPYPIAPAYAAEGHSGLYIMPEIGDTVELYFPGSRESGAYIRNAVPEGKRSVSGGSDHKVWGHPAGGSIGMSPEEVTLQAGSGMTITLNDQGVILESPGNLSIQGSNITFKAGQIEATAPEAIWLLGGGGSFILDGEANVRGSVIQQEGSNKAPVHVADLPPEPEPPLMPIEEYEAAQAAAAAEAAAATQASTTNPKAGSLFGAAGMIPIVGALVGAAVAAQAVGMAAAAAGVIGGIPKTGSFRPSAQNLLDRLTSGFVELQKQENEAKWMMLGKMLTAAKELTTASSLSDFMKKLDQQNKEISIAYEQVPIYYRDKWAREKADRKFKEALEFFKSLEEDDVKHQILFSPAYQEIAWALAEAGIYQNITFEQLRDHDFWLRQGLTIEEMEYITHLIYNPLSDQKFVELIFDFDAHRDLLENGTMVGGNLRVRTPDIEGKVIEAVGTGFKKVVSFAKKKLKDDSNLHFAKGLGSSWNDKNKSKKGESVSENGKVTDSESGSPPKPPKNASESESNNTSRTPSSKTSESDTTTPPKNNMTSKNKPNENESESPPKPAKNASESESTNTSRTPSSKTSETDTTTTPKNSTTSKNKQNQDDPPNEVNSWKTTAPKNKDEGKPQADSKPSESSQSDKPKENSNANKPKEDSEGTEGKGEVKYKEGYYFEHLTGKVEKVTEWKGVSGGHNYEEFKKFFGENGKYSLQEVKKLEHSDIPGIYDLEYRMMVEIKDYTGKGTGKFRYIPKEDKPPYKKTIYDPNIISNDEIIRLGKEAMEEGINSKRVSQLKSQNNKQIIRGVSSNGLKFEGIKNIDTGEIENFYPVLKFGEN